MEPLPPKNFYLQARVRLAIRFEEFQSKKTPDPPKLPPQLRKGTGNPQLDVVSKTTRDGNDVLLLQAKGSTQIGPCATATSSTDGLTHQVDGIIPISASFCRNGIRVADTLKIQLNFADFPFDARLIRSCGVEFYLGTVRAKDFGQMMELGPDTDETGRVLNMLPDEWVDARGRPRSNLRFQGWVDNWGNVFSEDEMSVSLECTDQTRLLIDQDAPPKLVVSDAVGIDQAVANYLANFPQFRGFAVQYRPFNAKPPVLKSAFAVTAYKPEGLGPSPQGNSKLAVWDYITDVCGAVGQICFVETVLLASGTAVPTIIIQRPRTLYGSKFDSRVGDQFVGRILPSGRDLSARTFVYGSNAISLNLERKFSKNAATNIEVRCFSPKQGTTLVVRYPDAKDERQKKLFPGNEAEQKWEVVRVTGIEDLPTLRSIAQGVYEGKQRSELTAHVHTSDLASLGGTNADPDVLDMMAGDNVQVEIDLSAESPGLNSMVADDEVEIDPGDFLRTLGYSDELAAAYSKAAANLHFPTFYRVRSVTVEYKGADDPAPEIDIELVNFIEVRSETNLPQGEEQSPDPAPTDSPDLVTLDYDE